MSKRLTTLVFAMFALLFAGAAMAAPADSPAPSAEPAAVQAAEAAPVPAAAASAAEAGVCQGPIETQGTPNGPSHFEECGDVYCPPAFYCCNPLQNLCVREGQVCIL